MSSRAWLSISMGVMMTDTPDTKDRIQLAQEFREIAENAGLAKYPEESGPENPPSPARIYDALITESNIRNATRRLFLDGHHAQAVTQAYKCLNNEIKKLTGSGYDGADLMHRTFSPDSPRLELNDFRGESKSNQQKGYMLIFSGCMTGIRNPRAHEHTHVDSTEEALEMLVWANHLLGVAKRAEVVKQK